ncbi:hypothetical protein GN244_ATG06734 [Phytophthora infestans]|uniref:Uncharacterized protein n=1 Tax=Phytophthora infestans TaxID=4787 RepID=A0A833SXB0_PHYIN|nr:hypothetical protein GN244_ATG06734 [Phytophthora infestans]
MVLFCVDTASCSTRQCRESSSEFFGKQGRADGRFAPPDSLLRTLDEAIANGGTDADLRLNARRGVQRAHVTTEEKLKLFITDGPLLKSHQLDEIVAAIIKSPKPTLGPQPRHRCAISLESLDAGNALQCVLLDVFRGLEERAFRSRRRRDLRLLRKAMTHCASHSNVPSRMTYVSRQDDEVPVISMSTTSHSGQHHRFEVDFLRLFLETSHKSRVLNTVPPCIAVRQAQRPQDISLEARLSPDDPIVSVQVTGHAAASPSANTMPSDKTTGSTLLLGPLLNLAKPEKSAPFQEWVDIHVESRSPSQDPRKWVQKRTESNDHLSI